MLSGRFPVCLHVCLSLCPFCLSVTLVYCSQTFGWIKMKPGMGVGLGPGHIVLDGDPAPLPKMGTFGQPPNFSPCLLWPNGWMDQDSTWHGGRPHCVRWGPGSPPPKEKHSIPQFSAHVLWPNGWMNQDATWYGCRPRPRPHCDR